MHPNEAVFVPRPGGDGEDDGVLLSVALNSHTRRSCLLALDARTMSECARAYVPHVVHFHFHGDFFPLA